MELEHRVIFPGAEDCQFEYFQRIWSIRTDLQPTMWVPHSCTAMLELSARRWVSTSRTWRSRNPTQVLAMAALAGSPPAFLTPWPLLDWLGPQNLSPFSKVNASFGPSYGYGIRYEYGIFNQRMENGAQVLGAGILFACNSISLFRWKTWMWPLDFFNPLQWSC